MTYDEFKAKLERADEALEKAVELITQLKEEADPWASVENIHEKRGVTLVQYAYFKTLSIAQTKLSEALGAFSVLVYGITNKRDDEWKDNLLESLNELEAERRKKEADAAVAEQFVVDGTPIDEEANAITLPSELELQDGEYEVTKDVADDVTISMDVEQEEF